MIVKELTRYQKLSLYKAGICPRLSWLLLIEELSDRESLRSHSHPVS